ncbi:RNA pseudouridine synthase 4, mitochondrial-like [Chenopodium quinoa]|uniref:RNA pseudouridine synthase 4, mitochondrial-like n=1 Tax=Chenopodium quinoa TaxID=63459 RepID=UPI000B783351|nr:RNA pseudouridine synthase 4, mitochondrial-like [Chenopodium quinoa]
MTGPLFFRQVLRSPAAAAKFETFYQQQCHRFTSAAVKQETHQSTAKNDGGDGGRGKGKWVTVPPYTSTVNVDSLGRRLSRRDIEAQNESIRTTMSALKWVVRCCPHLPQSLVQKLFRLRQVRRDCIEGDVDCSGDAQERRLKRVGAKDLMKKGERVFLPISVQGSSPVKKQKKYECSEEEMNFIRGLELYKDSAIIAINKLPKLPVQGGIGIKKSLDELEATCLRYDSNEPPRLVHRLDRDSSGILVMGRTQTSTAILHSVFREKTIGTLENNEIDWGKMILQKRYLALVFGVPKHCKGLISAPLAKVLVDDGKSERITIADRASSSQHAITEYRVFETSDYGYTWLELCPATGRKHQLRVHCAEVLGTPIVGDYKYGWQAHRRWEPLAPSPNEKFVEAKPDPLGLDLEFGSITEKQPHLHLHCKQMVLPNISLALDHVSPDSDYDFSKLESVNLVAPLPLHMQKSWDLLKYLAQQSS